MAIKFHSSKRGSESKINRFLRKKIEGILYPTKKCLPRWKEVGAKSNNIDDLGSRISEMNFRGEYIPIWAQEVLLVWYQHKKMTDAATINSLKMDINTLEIQIKSLKEK